MHLTPVFDPLQGSLRRVGTRRDARRHSRRHPQGTKGAECQYAHADPQGAHITLQPTFHSVCAKPDESKHCAHSTACRRAARQARQLQQPAQRRDAQRASQRHQHKHTGQDQLPRGPSTGRDCGSQHQRACIQVPFQAIRHSGQARIACGHPRHSIGGCEDPILRRSKEIGNEHAGEGTQRQATCVELRCGLGLSQRLRTGFDQRQQPHRRERDANQQEGQSKQDPLPRYRLEAARTGELQRKGTESQHRQLRKARQERQAHARSHGRQPALSAREMGLQGS